MQQHRQMNGLPMNLQYLWMMLGGHEEEYEPVEELDPVHAGDAHVEKDSEQYGEGDKLQYGGQHHRTA
jgi:hypothetical protein